MWGSLVYTGLQRVWFRSVAEPVGLQRCAERIGSRELVAAGPSGLGKRCPGWEPSAPSRFRECLLLASCFKSVCVSRARWPRLPGVPSEAHARGHLSRRSAYHAILQDETRSVLSDLPRHGPALVTLQFSTCVTFGDPFLWAPRARAVCSCGTIMMMIRSLFLTYCL